MIEVASKRRIIAPTRLSVSGFYCFGDQGMIPYESTLERDLLRKLAMSPRVLQIEAQPLTLCWDDDTGRARRYTPDYLVHWRSMGEFYRDREPSWLVEVKPRAVIRRSWLDLHPKFRVAARFAAEKGWRFRILDESRIRDTVFDNAVFLERYRRLNHRYSPEDLPPALLSGGVMCVGLVANHLFGTPSARQSYVWHLLGRRFLDCDLTQPLNLSTEVWLVEDP